MPIFEWQSRFAGQARGAWPANPTKNHSIRAWLVVILAALFILIWEQAGNAQVLYQVNSFFVQPSFQVVESIRAQQQNVQRWWVFTQQGGQHIARLESEVQNIRFDQAQLRVLQEENTALRAELSRPVRKNWQVAQWYGSSSQWFIDVGCRSGIQPGNVVAFENAFIGVVQDVYPTYSTVRTWEDPTWRLAAVVPLPESTASAYGIFSVGRSIPMVEEVSSSVSLDAFSQEYVFTAGQELVPPKYFLGTVERVESEPGFGTGTFVVRPAVAFQELDFVRVETENEATCS